MPIQKQFYCSKINGFNIQQYATDGNHLFSIKYPKAQIKINFIYSVDRTMDFNRAEPTCHRTNFPYASSGYKNAAFPSIGLPLRPIFSHWGFVIFIIIKIQTRQESFLPRFTTTSPHPLSLTPSTHTRHLRKDLYYTYF